MKRLLTVLLTLALLMGCALAETAYVGYNGLLYVENGSARQIAEGEVLYPQAANGGVYFVSRVTTGGEYDDEYEDTLYFADADGELTVIGEPKRMYRDYEYDENYSHVTDCTQYNGYTDMTVYGDHIYYIGDDGVGGTYTTHCTEWGDMLNVSYDTNYESGAALYRMDPDGSNVECLVSALGNAGAHLAVANDRIALSSCWLNSIYAYDFSNFMLYDLDGNLVKQFEGDAGFRNWIYKDEEAFTVIVEAIRTDGETIYASLADSEGDYASTRLMDIGDLDTVIAYEANYVDAVFADEGIVYLASDVKSTCREDGMENTLRISLIDGDGERMLAYIPAEYDSYGMKLSVSDGYAYLATEPALIRVPLAGGEAEKLENGGFVPAPECDPENYTPGLIAEAQEDEDYGEELSYLLPDSDTRLYTREELEGYDLDMLALMRNEILARHGYPFQKDKYKEYFGSRSWYVRNEDFEYSMLNEIEAENVETIKALEGNN